MRKQKIQKERFSYSFNVLSGGPGLEGQAMGLDPENLLPTIPPSIQASTREDLPEDRGRGLGQRPGCSSPES